MSSIKVAVRVRPFNSREKDLQSQCCISMSGQTTTISKPIDSCNTSSNQNTLQSHEQSKNSSRSFNFDHSYWSHNRHDANFASQEKVYSDMGLEMLEHALQGYNVCIIAYGQTGSGKSYTMMGGNNENDVGLIPRFCNDLFKKLPPKSKNLDHTVEVCYMEIYFEKVFDLLNPEKNKTLKVKYHSQFGNYVEDLTKLVVTCYEDVKDCIELGNKSRTVASTNMNATSSRSHAIFTINVTQKEFNEASGEWMEKVSKVSLVDLAGSERVESTHATGLRLKEGSNINTSLFVLARVISALAKGEKFVPYRESVLTTLLKENLGGNSKTAMISAISPADVNYDETLNTLKYANQTKKIHCKAIINENATAKRLRELMQENESLKKFLREMLEAQGKDISDLGKFLAEPDKSSHLWFNPGVQAISVQNKVEISKQVLKDQSIEEVHDESIRVDNEMNDKSTEDANDDNHSTYHEIKDPSSAMEKLKESEKLILELKETYEEKLKRTEAIKLKLTEREKILAQRCFKKWKLYNLANIRNELWNQHDYLNKARRVAIQRDKRVNLRFSLTRQTVYSTSSFYLNSSSASEGIDSRKKSTIQVEVNDLKTGNITHWSIPKLHQRLELMDNLSTKRFDLINSEDFDEACRNDPFYDRHPLFSLVGRSYLYITNLLHPVTVIQKVPIVNEQGDVKGYLRVVVQAVKDNEELSDVPEMGSISFNVEQSERIHFDDNDTNLHNIENEIDDSLGDLPFIKPCPTLRTTYYNDNSYSSPSDNSSRIFTHYPNIFEEITTVDERSYSLCEESSDESDEQYDDQVLCESRHLSKNTHLAENHQFTFRITVLQAIELPKIYSDVFCQCSFIHQSEPIFSTKPIKNTRPPSGFFSVKNITVTVTNAFLNYLKYHPILFEVFGLNQCHPSLREVAHNFDLLTYASNKPEAQDNQTSKDAIRRPYSHISPSLPLKPTKFVYHDSPKASSHIQARFDILVWFEICELAPNSDAYDPVLVDRSEPEPHKSAFLLHQGIQRKICITVVHEEDKMLNCLNVKEVLIGRIRSTIDSYEDDDLEDQTLSLTIFSAEYLKKPVDGRVLFRIEANWDTSLHNTTLLNRLTPQNERVFTTLSVYIEIEGCCRPVVISKDIAVMIVKRESEASRILSYANKEAVNEFRSFFSMSPSRNNRCHHMSSIYELHLLRSVDTSSPHRNHIRRLNNLSSKSSYHLNFKRLPSSKSVINLPSQMNVYSTNNMLHDNKLFEEEEIYDDRKYRFDPQAVIDEHQWSLEKIFRLLESEKTRHILLVKEKLDAKYSNLKNRKLSRAVGTRNIVKSNSLFNIISQTMSRSSSLASINSTTVGDTERNNKPQVWFMTVQERNICSKYIDLLTCSTPPKFNLPKHINDDRHSCDTSESSSREDLQHPRTELSESWIQNLKTKFHQDTSSISCQLIPELEEVRLSPIVSKRGYLYYMEEIEQRWLKRWFIVVRPYLIVFSNSRELLERDVINLTTSQIELPETDLNIGHVFTLITVNRVYLMHTDSAKELHDWIYALNPLLAGQVRSKQNAHKNEESLL